MNLDAGFSAIADPTRRAILARLALGEATVTELAKPFQMTQPAVSQHLKVLKETGWIEGEIDGPRVCYCPAPGAMARFRQFLQGLDSGERR